MLPKLSWLHNLHPRLIINISHVGHEYFWFNTLANAFLDTFKENTYAHGITTI